MIIDGISEAHRPTWSKLARLHSATIVLPMHTTRVEDVLPDDSSL